MAKFKRKIISCYRITIPEPIVFERNLQIGQEVIIYEGRKNKIIIEPLQKEGQK